MATGKVIGQIQVAEGNIKVIGVDGAVREPNYEGYVYENEQVVSSDPEALFQIKFLALPEASAYDGIFRILADGSVVYGRDAMESVASDESLADAIKTASGEGDMEDLETAAGEEGAEGSSSFTETDIVASSSVLGFFRGTNGELGYGITEFGTVPNEDAGQIPPPAITSPNVVIYDENDTIPVIQVTATSQGDVTYSIGGLDSEHFNIDAQTGLVTFKQSPDFENPKDTEGDNEYNMYVTVTDQYGNYTTQLLSVSVNNVNEAVTAVNDTINAVEDTVISSTIDLDANDYDVDGDNLTVIAGEFTTQEGGNIIINADGSYTYTPPANFNGVDSVEYTVTDGEFSDVGLLTINVGAVNDQTQIAPDTAVTNEDTPVTISVLANDTDIDGSVSAVASATNGSNGTTVVNSDGTITYTPNANFVGSDSFTYTNAEGNSATVSVLVNPINDQTQINNDSATTNEDTPVTISVLANDTDIDGSVSAVASATNGSNGTTVVNSNGTITYTPNANFVGSDSFTYTNTEGNSATVSVLVNPINDGPVAVDDVINAVEDTLFTSTIDLDANDTDISGDSLSVVAGTFTTVQGGTLVLASNGSYTYMPAANFHGIDTVDYTLTDGALTDVGTLTINVTAAADVPNLNLDIKETEKTTSEWVVDEEANEAAGIYQGEDGLYYKDQAVVIEDEYNINHPLNQGHYTVLAQPIELADFVELNMRFTGTSSATVEFFNGGNSIGTMVLQDGLHTYDPEGGQFDNVVLIVSEEQSSAIHLLSYSFEHIVPVEVDPIMEELITTVYEYTITPEAALTDTDGSEDLSEIEIDGIPDDVDLIDNGDGTYTFESEVQLSPDVLDSIIASVTSTEDSNGDEATITINQDGMLGVEAGSGNDTLVSENGDEVIDGGNGSDTLMVHTGDIDFSNIDNIEEIDLSSGNYTLSNITLADVLDITDGDKVLKITGESNDGVDNLADNGWVVDTTPSVSESGYTTYTNEADGSVQLLIDNDILIITD